MTLGFMQAVEDLWRCKICSICSNERCFPAIKQPDVTVRRVNVARRRGTGCYLAASKYRQEEDASKKGDSVYLSDTCVPLSKLADSIALTEKDFLDNGFKVGTNHPRRS